MDDSEMAKIALEAVIDDARDLGALIAGLMTSVERFIAITGSTAGAGLTLGLLQKQRGVLVVLPIALSVLYIYVVQIYTDAASYAGHQRYLESVINEVVGAEIMLARTRVAVQHDKRPSPVMSSVISILVLLCLATVSIWVQFHYYKGSDLAWVTRVGFLALLIFCALTVAQAVREYLSAERTSYDAASDANLALKLRAMLQLGT